MLTGQGKIQVFRKSVELVEYPQRRSPIERRLFEEAGTPETEQGNFLSDFPGGM